MASGGRILQVRAIIARLPLWSLWTGAILLIAAVTAVEYRQGDHQDFVPIWAAANAFWLHLNPYAVKFFLYPPGSFFLLFPFGGLTFDQAATSFLLVSGAAILGAGLASLSLVGVPWTSRRVPVVLAALIVSSPAVTNQHLLNVNAFIALLGAGTLLAAVRGRWLLSGALLGVSLAIKPLLIPLLAVTAIRRRWGTLAASVVVGLAISVAAVTVTPHWTDFITSKVPYLWDGQPLAAKFNVSLSGVFSLLGVPYLLTLLAQLTVLAVVTAAVLTRVSRRPELTTMDLIDISTVVLLLAFIDFAYSLAYYELTLVPFFVSFAVPRSMRRDWLIWAGLLLLLVPVEPVYRHLSDAANTTADIQVCLGQGLVLAALCIDMLRTPAAGPAVSTLVSEPLVDSQPASRSN